MKENLKKIGTKRLVFAVLAIIAFVVIAYFITPPEGLNHNSMICLGIFIWAVFCWIGQVFPLLVTWMVIFSVFVLSGATSLDTAASGFKSSVSVFLVGAMGISVALTSTGLMRRIAFGIMKLFKPTFKGQTIGMLVMNTVVNMMVPSAAAKAAMVFPLAKEISDGMGYKPKSKGLHGIALAAFIGSCVLCNVYYNANFFIIFVRATLPAAVQDRFGFIGWTVAALPWYILTFIISAVAINTIFKPAPGETLMNQSYLTEELKKMGKMSAKEVTTLVVLILAVIMWALESKLGISSCAVAIAACAILLGFRVFSVKECLHGITWEMVLVIGTMTGMGNVFKEVGINAWMGKLMEPLISRVQDSKFLLLMMLAIVVYLVRLLITSQLAALPIIMSIFLPVCDITGINPWVIGFVALTCSAVWTFLYQNTLGVQLLGGFGGEENLDYKKMAIASAAYMVINMGVVAIQIPFWTLLGIM